MEDSDLKKLKGMELVRFLEKGKMLSHPIIHQLVDRALRTGDFGLLQNFIEKYPVFLVQTDRNIQQAEFHSLSNPFPFPTRDDVKESLSGPIKLGFVNEFDDTFGIDPNDLTKPMIIPGRVGSGKSNFIKGVLITLAECTEKNNG